MKNVTVIYLPNSSNEIQSFHVQHATTKNLQEALDSNDIYMFEHILEQTRTIGTNQFKVYATQDELVDFINKWDLNY